MAEAVIKDFVSGLGLDKYQIDPDTRIQEYASVMAILKKHRRGLNEERIRDELDANFPDLRIDSLKDILKELKVAKQISEEGGMYSLTGFGYTNIDYITTVSKVVIKEEIDLDLISYRFWGYVREYTRK